MFLFTIVCVNDFVYNLSRSQLGFIDNSLNILYNLAISYANFDLIMKSKLGDSVIRTKNFLKLKKLYFLIF